jgi:hypothetical protein
VLADPVAVVTRSLDHHDIEEAEASADFEGKFSGTSRMLRRGTRAHCATR